MRLALPLACCGLLGGCVLVGLGAAAGGGYTLAQERGVSGTFSDTTIKTEINALWLKEDGSISTHVDLSVFNGQVLLSGDVPTPELRDKAVAAAWRADGVKQVINEIGVAPDQGFGSGASDTWIQKKIQTNLLFDSEIKSVNYSVEVNNGIVYILGSARTQAELDRVTNYARNTADVRKVVSYVTIRAGTGEQPVGGQSAAPQPRPQLAPAPLVQGNPGASAPPGDLAPESPRAVPAPVDTGAAYAPPPPVVPGSTIQAVPLQ